MLLRNRCHSEQEAADAGSIAHLAARPKSRGIFLNPVSVLPNCALHTIMDEKRSIAILFTEIIQVVHAKSYRGSIRKYT